MGGRKSVCKRKRKHGFIHENTFEHSMRGKKTLRFIVSFFYTSCEMLQQYGQILVSGRIIDNHFSLSGFHFHTQIDDFTLSKWHSNTFDEMKFAVLIYFIMLYFICDECIFSSYSCAKRNEIQKLRKVAPREQASEQANAKKK